MTPPRFSEEQIIGALKEADAGMKVAGLCRKHGMAEAALNNWRRRDNGMNVPEIRAVVNLSMR